MKTHIALKRESLDWGYRTRCGRLAHDNVTGRRGPFDPEMDLCLTCKKSAEDALVCRIESDTKGLAELQSHSFDLDAASVDGSET